MLFVSKEQREVLSRKNTKVSDRGYHGLIALNLED